MQVQEKTASPIIQNGQFPYHIPAKWLDELVKHKHRLALGAIMLLSTFLRFYRFGQVPDSLNGDEASAAYDSYALLIRGTDRWGYHFPVYFPGWGSGMNVLESYLDVPFIKLFGLSLYTIRLMPDILGVLSVFLLYLLVKKVADVRAGLVAALLLGTTPWHIMISRWTIESNILPFFLLLGMTVLVYCYEAQRRKWLIPFSFSILGLALYAYATSIFVIPGIIALYTLGNWRAIWRYKYSYVVSLGVFLLVAFPFLLFILDNFVLHRTPSFVKYLPFSVPLLVSSRLSQVSTPTMLVDNLHFVTGGFFDGNISNTLWWYFPLGLLTGPMSCLGIYFSLKKRSLHGSIFVLWLLAELPIFKFYGLNITRANSLYMPLIALSGIGVIGLYDAIQEKRTKNAIISVLLAASLVYSGAFSINYFKDYNLYVLDDPNFNAGLDAAFAKATGSARSNEPILVTESLNPNFSYVFTLFYEKIDPLEFETQSHYYDAGGHYQVDYYRNWYFRSDSPVLAAASSYVAIIKGNIADAHLTCSRTQILYQGDNNTVERCFH